jgi:hypothetical protein
VTTRPLRPLAIVVLLAFGDYLLWNWSLSGSHDVLALVAGLTLTPLLIALAWLVVVSVARICRSVARYSRIGLGALTEEHRARLRRSSRSTARRATGRRTRSTGSPSTTRAQSANGLPDPAGTTATASSSSKLAA